MGEDIAEPQSLVPERRYAAFISYRHLPEDRKWAKWTLDKLERFRTPRALVKRGFARRVGIIYRDEDENPASAQLGDQIEQALRSSGALIVVASRDTPKSHWVNREVEFFEDLGKRDRILTLLIDGEPGVSYPSALLKDPDREPIAADVRPRVGESAKTLERHAYLRLAAALLGCGFDDLRQRDRQRRRQRNLYGGLAVAAALIVAALVWYPAERAARIARVQLVAAEATTKYSFNLPLGAALTFRALPKEDWFGIGLPTGASAVIMPRARLGATTATKFEDEEAAPTIVAPWKSSGAAIGLLNGTVQITEDGTFKTVIEPSFCSSEDFGARRCGITALATSGARLVAGTMRGEVVRTDDGGTPLRLTVSDVGVDQIVWLPSGDVLIADARGTLTKLDATGGLKVVADQGGTVARMIPRPDGRVLILRVGGNIEYLQPSGSLVTWQKSDMIIRDGGFIRGELMTIEMQRKAMFNYDNDAGSVVVLRRDAGNRTFPFKDSKVDLPTDFSKGVLFSNDGEHLIVGNGLTLNVVRPLDESYDSIAIADKNVGIEDRNQTFFFKSSLIESADGNYFWTLSEATVFRIDKRRLAEIDAVALSHFGVRNRLCAMGLGQYFIDKEVVDQPC